MRFCMLTTFYPPWSFGGDAVQVQRLSEALARRGHDVTVVHSREAFSALNGDPPPPDPPPGDVRLVAIDAGRGMASPLATHLTGRPLLVRRQLARALAEPFDVLHLHNPSLLGGPAVLTMGTGRRVYTLHEQWLLCPTHVLWKNNRRLCDRPQCVRCAIAHRRPPQPWRATGLLDRALRHVDLLLAPSDTTARLHARLATTVRIERLDHFVPDPGPPLPPQATATGRPYVLFAGRLEPIKAVEDAIEAIGGLDGVDLVVAGAGSLARALRRQAAGLDGIRFTGWLTPATLDRLYRGALAVILPTRGYESSPLVLLEALARGVPILARPFGGQGELVATSGGGLTFDGVPALRQAVLRLVSDLQLRARLAAAGRAAYEQRWTEAVHVERYLELVDAGRPAEAAPS